MVSQNPTAELGSFLFFSQKKLKLKRRRYQFCFKRDQLETVSGEGVGLFGLHFDVRKDDGWTVTHLPTHRSVVKPFTEREQAETFLSAIIGLEGWDTEDSKELARFESLCSNLRYFIVGNSLVPSAIELVMDKLRKG